MQPEGPVVSKLIPFFAIASEGLEDRVSDYVTKLEVDETPVWCKCPWMVHPDDKGKPFKEARKRRTDNDPECPVHTREGLILGFIRWDAEGGH